MYRGLEHGAAKNNCKVPQTITTFPDDIQDFANAFVAMQAKRHQADYDPDQKLSKTEVLKDIALCEDVIDRFMAAPKKDRLAFAAYVLFKRRKE